MLDVRKADIAKLNSLTKYPSIPTYHKLGDKGILLNERNIEFNQTETVYLTEKIDGTNGRIILLSDGNYLIGSREELLTYSEDLIANPSLGIVDALSPIAQKMKETMRLNNQSFPVITVFYFEVYGGKIGGAAKQYTSEGRVGVRLFDASTIADFEKILDLPINQIASWRENNKQKWLPTSELTNLEAMGTFKCVPYLVETIGDNIPSTIEGTNDLLLKTVPVSFAQIDSLAKGNAEGFILRNASRSKIAKVRYEDYNRTIKAQKKL